MRKETGEENFLRENCKKETNAYLYRIAVLGCVTVALGACIWLIGYGKKQSDGSSSSGIKTMEATAVPKAELGEYAFSVSAEAVAVENTDMPAVEVEPITRGNRESAETVATETVKKSKTPKPTKTPEPNTVLYEDAEEEDEDIENSEEKSAHSAKSILADTDEETAVCTPHITEAPTVEPEETPEPTPAYTTLSKHDSSAEVTKLQERLMELGFLDIDEPTEYYGSVTESAVRLFQRQHNLTIDGVAGQETQTLLYSDTAQKYCLKVGMEGGDVKMLQQQLCELGYLSENEIDSVYGETTVAAVKNFQSRNDLHADGLAGEKTLEILYSDGAKISYALYKQQKEAEASAAAAAKKKTATPKPTATPKKDTRKEKFLAAAKSKLGCEYILGDCGPKTFDCSGFVYWCLRQAGVSVTRLNAAGFSNKSSWKKITSISDLEAGDILFFRSDTKKYVNHCGIYVGSGNMIDASSGHGEVIKRALSAYWKRNFVCARRPW